MTAIGSITEFDVSNPTGWDNYVEQLKFFMLANDIFDVNKQRAVLLAVCGLKTLGILRSLLAPISPAEKSFEEIIKVLKNHFAPTSSEIYLRFQFHKRNQGTNESVSSYVTDLRRLAENCNFGTSLTERLRDQLVCGMRDENLQRRLLAESTLTFNEAFSRAVAAETAAEQAKNMHSYQHNSNHSTNSVRPKASDRKFSKPVSSNPAKAETLQSSVLTCYSCGANHERSGCKFRDSICRFCKKKGHIERICRAKRNSHSNSSCTRKARNPTTFAVKREEINDSSTIYNVCNTRHGYMKRSVSIRLGKSNCIMEVDSGSDYSIISSQQFDRIWPKNKPDITPLPFQLCDYQKSPIGIRGQCYVDVHYGRFKGKLRLLIAEGSRANLLGIEWFEPLGIRLVGVHHTDGGIERVLEEFKDVFSENLGSYTGPAISLPIDPKFPPITFKARNIPIAMRKKVDIAIDKLLDQGVLEPIANPKWSTPIVPIIKQSGEIRLCADYKVTINKAMQDHPFPIPSVSHILANLAGGKFFAKIDLAQAYLQLKVDDASAEAQTIVTHRGAYRVKRLQFGVNVAPGLFQSFIEDLLRGILGVLPYFDDVLVFAATLEELIARLRQVLDRLSKAGIRANRKKCIFNAERVEFLGFEIDSTGIHPSASKVKAIHEAPCPTNKTELQAFLGLLNFYHSFLQDKATIAEPLHKLLQKNVEWKWSKIHEKAFSAVKRLLSSDSVLVPFDEKLPIILTCDASPYGVGYVLSHKMPDGREAPIAFASRTLTSAERNYSQLDKEALGIIAGVKKFHYFLYGHKFTLVTDHQPLLGLFNKLKLTPDILSPRMLRWSQMLNAYDFTLIHRPGKKIQNADALSRLPLQLPDVDTPPPPEVLFLEELTNPPVTADEISRATLRDPILSRVLNWVLKGWPNCSKEFSIFYLKRNELSVHKNCLLWGSRVVVPQVLRDKVLKELHLYHPGIEKMKLLARSYVWWPGMEEDIGKCVGLCEICQQSRHAPPRAPLHPWEVTSRPWSRLHIDFAGPFQGQMFFVLVDSFSKWLEVRRLSSATSDATIKVLRDIFAIHGIPDSVVSDNGSQFTSAEFKSFLAKNGIRQILVAPYHPSSNGQAERVVQTTKDALKRIIIGNWNQRLSSFLLSQHITPSTVTGFSPAELLMKRRLRSVLDLLHPDLLEDRRNKTQQLADKNSSTGQTRSFLPNDAVYIKNHTAGQAWIPGTIVEKSSPLSYKALTPDGRSIRCHVDQMRDRKTPDERSSPSPELTNEFSSPDPTIPMPTCVASPLLPEDPPVPDTPKKSPVIFQQHCRPRRKITRPAYLRDYVT